MTPRSQGQWPRRDVLRAAGAGLLAGSLGAAQGCSSDDGATKKAPHVPRAKVTDIDHIVVFIQENRSFDHYFGTRKGVRGFADPQVGTDPAGRTVFHQRSDAHPDGYVLPWHLDTTTTKGAYLADIDHSWQGQHTAWNNGRMDGYASTMGPSAVGYYTRSDIPLYWWAADQFTLCDSYFCSVLGPTTPNRYYSMTGTIDAAGAAGGPAFENSVTNVSWETYPERLTKAGISWRVYHEADDFDDNCLKFFTQYKNAPAGNPLHDNALVDLSPDAFAADASAGNLPQVSWIVAPPAKSEHPPYPPAFGEQMIQQYLVALMSTPKAWARTAFIVTFDENGGFFDHVAPPTPPPDEPGEWVAGQPIGFGPRVPTLVMSPWSRGGHVRSDIYDHTSLLRFIETRFGVEVPNLSAWRRRTSTDLIGAFDFETFDTSPLEVPDQTARVAAITETAKLPTPTVPAVQKMPGITA